MLRYLQSILLSAAFLASQVQGQEPSLEDLEALGAELNAVEPKTEAAKPAEPKSEPVVDVLPIVSDMSGIEPIDVQSRMKKILEPNLFAGAPPQPGSLRNLAIGEAPEEYEVQEGDNLYDICDQLIDEAGYWPKLWAFNPLIANPHFVYPGMRLRFFYGDAETPPFLQVVTEDDILPVDKAKIVEAELVKEDISGMLTQAELPTSMEVIDASELGNIPGIEEMFVAVGGTYKNENLKLIIPAFVVTEEMPEIGEVVGGSAGSFLLDKGQDVILKDSEGLKVGTTYSVVRESGKVESAEGDRVGYRYEFIAQVQVNTQDKDDEDIFKGRVLFNRLGPQPGDILVPYKSVKRTAPVARRSAGKASNQLVVGFTNPDTVIGGRGDFVFIDQSAAKVREGETYSVLQNIKVASASFLRDQLPDTDSKVALVYIVDASGAAATGYVVNDALEVRLGDRLAP